VHYDVPYFFVCPDGEDLFFNDFVRVGTRIMFRRSPHQDFKMGTVTAVQYRPVVRHNGSLDVRGDDGRTSFNLPPLNYRFPHEYYVGIIRRHQRCGKDIRPSRADVFNEVVEDGTIHIANELLNKMKWTTEDGVRFGSGWLYSYWRRDFGRDMGVPGHTLDTLDDDKFVEKVAAHMGSNFQWHKKVYGDGSYHYMFKMRPSEDLLREIRESALLPTESPGVGGAMYREARESFANNR
jgi:hypothetical protein